MSHYLRFISVMLFIGFFGGLIAYVIAYLIPTLVTISKSYNPSANGLVIFLSFLYLALILLFGPALAILFLAVARVIDNNKKTNNDVKKLQKTLVNKQPINKTTPTTK